MYWGHGFLPRIHSGNAGPVDRRLEPPKIARSVFGRDWSRFAALPNIKGLLVCTLPCCRFRRFDEILSREGEHSLYGRVTEASDLNALPATVRAESVWRDGLAYPGLQNQQGSCNGDMA